MKYNILTIALSAMVILGNWASARADQNIGLNIELVMGKNLIKSGQPIGVWVDITNKTNHGIVLTTESTGVNTESEFVIDVRDAANARLELKEFGQRLYEGNDVFMT